MLRSLLQQQLDVGQIVFVLRLFEWLQPRLRLCLRFDSGDHCYLIVSLPHVVIAQLFLVDIYLEIFKLFIDFGVAQCSYARQIVVFQRVLGFIPSYQCLFHLLFIDKHGHLLHFFLEFFSSNILFQILLFLSKVCIHKNIKLTSASFFSECIIRIINSFWRTLCLTFTFLLMPLFNMIDKFLLMFPKLIHIDHHFLLFPQNVLPNASLLVQFLQVKLLLFFLVQRLFFVKLLLSFLPLSFVQNLFLSLYSSNFSFLEPLFNLLSLCIQLSIKSLLLLLHLLLLLKLCFLLAELKLDLSFFLQNFAHLLPSFHLIFYLLVALQTEITIVMLLNQLFLLLLCLLWELVLLMLLTRFKLFLILGLFDNWRVRELNLCSGRLHRLLFNLFFYFFLGLGLRLHFRQIVHLLFLSHASCKQQQLLYRQETIAVVSILFDFNADQFDLVTPSEISDGAQPKVVNLRDLCTNPLGMSSFPLGAVLKISSILFSIQGVNFRRTAMAFTVSSSCSTLVAPVIAVETSGLLITQAMASCAIVQPIYFDSASNQLRAFKVFSRFLSFKYFSKNFFRPGFLSNRLPYGMPWLYFPVRTPLARGDQTVLPIFLSSNKCRYLNSTLFLMKRLYSGCSTTGLARPYFSQTIWAQAISWASHQLVPQQNMSPLRISQSNARQVSSMGVSQSWR